MKDSSHLKDKRYTQALPELADGGDGGGRSSKTLICHFAKDACECQSSVSDDR